MIKAVIFDCFGVLVESSLEPFCEKYFSTGTTKIAQVKQLDRQANSGQISYDEFVAKLAELAGISDKEAGDFLDNNPANTQLLDFIKQELKPKYKIGFLSNASDDWLDELFSTEQLQLFDDIILSYQHNLVKPDSAIFELAAQRLGVDPSECIFIDDLPTYCEGAKNVGMYSICYKSFNQLHDDLAFALRDS